MKNTDIYVDLYECTEEEIKTIFDLLPKPQFDDDYDITPRGGRIEFSFLHCFHKNGYGKKWYVDYAHYGKKKISAQKLITMLTKV